MAGDDTLSGGPDRDIIDGGADSDTVSYVGATRGVQVDLVTNFARHDGGDRLLNLENITGSSFDDTLRGDDTANVIDGGAGDDLLEGRAGDDTIIGGDGVDIIDGGDGTDTCTGEHATACEA
jgi:Ca2+-binding RTX toxin-like protein